MQTTDQLLSRIAFSGSIEQVLQEVCKAYELGVLHTYEFVTVGLEDCNLVITLENTQRYFVKIFAKERSHADVVRYVDVMRAALSGGVLLPKLFLANGVEVYSPVCSPDLQLLVMQFVEGQTFFSLHRIPTTEELQQLMRQVATLHTIDYRPVQFFDSWAVPNIGLLFEKVSAYLSPEDRELVDKVISQFRTIDLVLLPHAFVHGDLIKTNVIKATHGGVVLLDFSVANWYPRIQELAVIAVNLLFDEGKTGLRERVNTVSKEYQVHARLTEYEHSSLYVYALAAATMEFLGGYQEKYAKQNNSAEVEFWLELGRSTLKDGL